MLTTSNHLSILAFVKMFLRKFTILLPLVLALQLSGCASLVSDNTYDVSILSEPSNAPFTILDDQGELVAEGVTPAIVSLDSFSGYFRRANYNVTFSHANHPEKAVRLMATLSPFYFVNYPFGGGIGFFIDPFTGAMFNLPKETRANLTDKKMDTENPWN